MPVTVRTNESRARQKSAASDMATRNQPSAPKRTRAIRVNVAASDAAHRGKRDPRFVLRRTQNSGSDRQRVAHARSILGTGSGRAKSHSRPVGKPPSRPVGRAIAAELSRSYRLYRTLRKEYSVLSGPRRAQARSRLLTESVRYRMKALVATSRVATRAFGIYRVLVVGGWLLVGSCPI